MHFKSLPPVPACFKPLSVWGRFRAVTSAGDATAQVVHSGPWQKLHGTYVQLCGQEGPRWVRR
ncbi:hypothetical protein C8R44DRAFT_774918 [Mycena epipterygia]|nr:hypothetical protein C8R44DRAFT_774918 [Mycena epipterygia]